MSNKEQNKALDEYKKITGQIKKRLKPMSKSQLIAIITDQQFRYKELQMAAAQLLEENKALNGKASEEVTIGDSNE